MLSVSTSRIVLSYPCVQKFARSSNDPDVEVLLVNALDDNHHDIQIFAAEYLHKFDAPELRELGFNKLTSMLKHENVNARGNAAGALGRIGDKRAINPLRDLFNSDNDRNDYARRLAQHYLKVLGAEV